MELTLQSECGPLWLQVADDLDNAVAEWGGYIERKIKNRIDDYIDGVRERDEQSRKSMGKHGTFKPTHITREELDQIWEETWLYYVKGIIRRHLGDPSGKYDGLVWEKVATYDPKLDANWNVGEVTIRPVGKPKPVRADRTLRRG